MRGSRSHREVLIAVGLLVAATCVPSVGFVPLTEGGTDGTTVGLEPRTEIVEVEAPATSIPLAPPVLPSQPFEPHDHVVQTPPPAPGGPPAPAPAPLPPPPPLPPVQAQLPRLRLAGVPGDAGPVVGQVMGVKGVAFATALTVGLVPVAGGDGPTAVQMAAVDPQGFRVLTPQVTADAVGVWHRLMEGDAAFTHDVGNRLELQLGSEVPAAGRTTLRVGAFASNGVPPVADAVVSRETAGELGLQGVTNVLIALAPDARPADVAARLRRVTGLQPEILEPPQTRRAFISGAAARRAFEPYTYVDRGDGTIQIDPGWVRRNIVAAPVPILRGHVVCHRLMIPQLQGALQEIADRGLAHLIDPSQYGGCWVPRHIDWSPSKPLSMHSWGLAVDLNVSTNGLGRIPTMDPRIVEVFDRWGFVWGGRWRRPDGMHFELGALLESTGG
ncbi:MAG: M15 family metallopeptidase [Actinomycetota bacterium]|nr:M15 family metallopeptidase [Actinomycetota bacterium]